MFPIYLNYHTNNKGATVLSDYTFSWKENTYVIPAGYNRFDGMTGGNFLLSLIGLSRWGVHNAATLPHDYLYVNQGKIMSITNVLHTFKRKEVDEILDYYLDNVKCNKVQRVIVKTIVRTIGYFYWIKHS